MTSAEARARRKELAGPKLSRAERKAERGERRARMDDRREKMMAGEEAYLLPRDKGPIRAYVRDIVDSRRNLLGLFMPVALFMIFIMLGVPQVQLFISPAMLVLMAVMAVDALLLARKVRNKVDVKFPDNTESSWKLGTYAAGRASQLRRMRAPRPRVNRGDQDRLTPRSSCAPWCSAVSGRASPAGPKRLSPSRATVGPVRYLATGPPPTPTRPGPPASPPTAPAGRRTGRPSKVPMSQRNCAPTPELATLVDDVGGWLTAAMDRSDAWAAVRSADAVTI